MYIPPKEYIVKLLNETHYIAQGAAGENWRKKGKIRGITHGGLIKASSFPQNKTAALKIMYLL